MNSREWPRLLVGAVVLGLLAWFVTANLRLTTDITHFVPGGAVDSSLALARQVAVGELSRTMVVLVETRDGDEAAVVSREFEQLLRDDPIVTAALASLEGGPQPGFEEALWRLYEPRRFAFAAADAAAVRARLDDAGLERAVDHLKRKLATPMASMLSRVAPGDPLLVVPSLFESLSGRGDALGLVDDRYVTTDGRAAVFFLTTSASASDSAVQRPFLERVRTHFATVNARHGGTLALRLGGTNRHAIAAEDSIKADIERVSTWSTITLLVTFLLLFASLRLPLSWVPVLVAGFFAGAAACIVVFGAVHGMTIAFGASLIGVSIDYAVHFYCHQALAPAATPRATMTRILPGLMLGCATTVVGFLVLLVATFPGLREMALFAAVGLAASLLAGWLFLPGLVGRIGSTATSRFTVRVMDRLTGLRGRARLVYVAVLGTGVVLCAVGLPHARWNDRISSLNRLDPILKAEDDLVVQRVAKVEQRRLAIVVGDDEERALQGNERVAAVLTQAQADGVLQGFRGAAAALPSAQRQREVDAAMRADATLWPRLEQQLQRAGFVSERFQPFRDALAAPAPAPLTSADLLATPLAGLVRSFRMPLAGGRCAWLSYLSGLRDEAALRTRLAAVPGAMLLDVEGAMTDAFAAYRERMATLLGWGVFAVLALVVVRYRKPRLIALSVVPALLGAGTTVALLALCGIDLTMLSLVALLMVVSMGVDYGIFLAEDEQHPEARGATQLGVLVDGLTTMLGFGLLAISAQPALFGIGITAGLGVTCCLGFALAFGALLAPARTPAI